MPEQQQVSLLGFEGKLLGQVRAQGVEGGAQAFHVVLRQQPESDDGVGAPEFLPPKIYF
jgi:hypothetical protein